MSAPVRYLGSLIFLAGAFVLVWLSNEVLLRAQQIFGSTFETQPARFSLAYFLLALSGAAIAIVIMLNVGRPEGHRTPIVVAASITALMVVLFLVWFNGINIGLSPFNSEWLFSPATQTIASFCTGLLATFGLGTKSSPTAE